MPNIQFSQIRILTDIEGVKRRAPSNTQDLKIRASGNIDGGKSTAFTGETDQFGTSGNIYIRNRTLVKVEVFQL